MTLTLVTSELAADPEAPDNTQSNPSGCVSSLTENVAPESNFVEKTNEPFPIDNDSALLINVIFSFAESPSMVPPTEYVFVVQVIAVATGAEAVPELGLTTHVCHGFVGCDFTVTEYESPLTIGVANVTCPFTLTGISPAPFSWITRPDPAKPEIVALTGKDGLPPPPPQLDKKSITRIVVSAFGALILITPPRWSTTRDASLFLTNLIFYS